MASKSRNPSVHKKDRTPDEKNDHRGSKKTGSSDITNPQVFKKINPPELPVIGINCAGSITHIRNALITYCQKELGPISKMFIDGKYEDSITVEYEASSMTAEKDPLGLKRASIMNQMKQADLDNAAYEKSKGKLYGIISSMTTKEVDEKLSVHRSLIKVDTTLPKSSNTPKATQKSADQAFFNCPLNLWKDIVHVVTTKTAGNKRIDQDKVTVDFAIMRQRPNESLADFHHRMSHIVDSFEMLGLEKPPAATQAMRFIQGLDSARYATMQTSFANELHNGRDLYPTDLPTAVLKASRWMVSGRTPQDSFRALAATKPKKGGKGTGEKEDKEKSKPKKDDKEKPATKCEFCGRPGHSMSACYKFKDAQANALAATDDKTKSYPPSRKGTTMVAKGNFIAPDCDYEEPHYLVNIHLQAKTSSVLAAGKQARFKDEEIILDTGANGSIFSNPALLDNIRTAERVTFDGISGVLSTDKVGELHGICQVHLHPDALANILSFSQLRELGHSITYHEGANPWEDSFTIEHGSGQLRFTHRASGLYVHDTKAEQRCLVTTVTDNESKHSKREVAQAREARQLQRRLANPPDAKLIKALNTGTIQNATVTPADVARATAIYGPSIEAIKGRTTTRPALPFPTEGPLRATSEQKMYADIFFANALAFEITITHPIGNTICSYIERTDTVTLRRTLRTHLGTYGQRRIPIRHIYSDNEKGILCMTQDFAGAGITLHLAGPGMHVHVIERTIRTIKEGVRGLLAGLPYPCPKCLFIHMVPFVANRANMFPSSTRTDNMSPFQLMYNRPINAAIDCNLEFGAYYQISNRIMDNSMMPRTIGAIGIAHTGNGTGTCKFYALHNGAVISANHFRALPMPSEVIAHLTHLAEADKVKIQKDPVFQISALANPEFTGTDSDQANVLPVPAEEAAQDLTLLDTIQPERPPSPPPTTHRADDLLSPTRADIDRRGVPLVHSDDILDNGVPDARDEPLTADTPLTAEDDINASAASENGNEEDAHSEMETPDTSPASAPLPYAHPQRIRRPPEKLNLLSVYHITARRALKENPNEALPVIRQELETLLRKGVFHGIEYTSLTQTQRKGIIRSQMNVTQKYAPSSDGNGRIKDKLKARLVGGGDGQDRNLYSRSETSSPTASTSAILIIAQLAAAEGRHVISLDIGSAYLNANMPKDDPSKLVFMAIAPLIAGILTDIDPGFKKFMRPDGSIIVELDQALYGCIESALLWYNELSTFLGSIGFRPNPYEKCILNKEQSGTQTTIAVYVDDLLITSGSQQHAAAVVTSLRDRYKELKVTTGNVHNYLGMVLDFSSPPCVTVRQNGMVEDIVTKAKASTHIPIPKLSPKSPCTEQLFSSSPDSPPLSEAAKAEFHSYTAKWLFVGGHGRPDLLTPISYFTKRVLNPTEEDARKLGRTIGYADSTSSIALTLRSNLPPKITTFIDASFATHPDMRSHSGVCISLGRGVYYSKSTAQKLNTTSSCEAELVALSKGMQQSLWSSYFVEEQGYPRSPIAVLQDNQSTVRLIENGRPTSELSRHIRIGYFWLHDLLVKKIIRLIYCPTENMIADLMTKPLQGSLFRTMRDRVMGIVPCPMTD